MRYYLIAGEASGDLHGSNLIKEIRLLDPAAELRCWGGDQMESAGATVVKHYRDLAFMGFVEVLRNLRTIFRNIDFCKEDVEAFAPDVLILIDYPGFNLRIAKWAHKKGLKVVYYISPQVWAWKANRVKSMKRCIDKMICILPFEKDYYKQQWNWEVEYVGHPLVEVVDRYLADHKGDATPDLPVIALLPGSRQQEILKKLPVMLEVTRHFPGYRFVVAKAPGLEESFYNELLAPYANVSWVVNRTYQLLSQSTAALVTSGTATLETALFGVPEVICYKGNSISYQIAKRLIKIRFIGLVNLIMDKEVVKELIQDDLTVDKVKQELELLLTSTEKQAAVKQDYAALKKLLSQGGNASANAAKSIMTFLRNGN